MLDNNKINEKQAENVSGGVMVDGRSYVRINQRDIEGYEYRCRTCGYVGYREKNSGTANETCPRCQAQGKYQKTGRFYMDYNKCSSAATDAYYYNS